MTVGKGRPAESGGHALGARRRGDEVKPWQKRFDDGVEDEGDSLNRVFVGSQRY